MDIDIQASNINLRLAALAVAIQAGVKEEQVKRDNGTTVTISRGENGQFASRKGGAASAAKEEKLANTPAGGKTSNPFNLSKEEDAELTTLATGPVAKAALVSVSEVVADSPELQKAVKEANPGDVAKAKGDNIIEKAGNYMKEAFDKLKRGAANNPNAVGAALIVGAVVAAAALTPLVVAAGGPGALAFATAELSTGNIIGASAIIGKLQLSKGLLNVASNKKTKNSVALAAYAASILALPIYMMLKKPIRALDNAIKSKAKEAFNGAPAPEVTPEADKVMTEIVTSPTTNKAKLVAVEEIRKTDPELADAVKDAKLEDIPKAKGKNILEKISNFVKEKQEQASKIVDAHKQDIAYAAAGTVGVIAGVSLAGLAVSAVFGGGALAAITSMSGTIMIGMGGFDIATGNVAGGIISVLAGGGFKALMNQGMLKGNAQIAALLGMAAVRGVNVTINEKRAEEKAEKRKQAGEAATNKLKEENAEQKKRGEAEEEQRQKDLKALAEKSSQKSKEEGTTSKEQYLRNREAGATLT